MAGPRQRRSFYSVNLAEEQDQYQELAMLLENQQRLLESEQAKRRAKLGEVFDKDGVGKFIIPEHNSWAAHHDAVLDHGLQFDPEQYPVFDAIIAKAISDDAFSNKRHAYYQKYDGLRTNLAILRNFLYDNYFPDGSFDADDMAMVPCLREMARDIGVAINNGGKVSSFTRELNVALLNNEPLGAKELYSYLLSLQRKPGIINNTLNIFYRWAGRPLRVWELPELQYTPFCDNEHLFAAAPGALINYSPADLPPPIENIDLTSALKISAIADQIGNSHKRLKSVHGLGQPVLDEAVEIAREILRKLRMNPGNNDDVDEMLRKQPDDMVNNADDILAMVLLFEDNMIAANTIDADLLKNEDIDKARLSVGHIAFYLKSLAASAAEQSGDQATAAMLTADLATMPESWKSGSGLRDALAALKKGLERVSEAVISSRQEQAQEQNQFSGIELPPIPGSMQQGTKYAANPHDTRNHQASVKIAHRTDEFADMLRARQEQRKAQQHSNQSIDPKRRGQINNALKQRINTEQLKNLHNYSTMQLTNDQDAVNPSTAQTLKKIKQDRQMTQAEANKREGVGMQSKGTLPPDSHTALLQQQRKEKEFNTR